MDMSSPNNLDPAKIEARLGRIARALEIMTGTPSIQAPEWAGADKFIWDAKIKTFRPVVNTSVIPPLSLLVGIDQQIDTIYQNTFQFAQGFSANNILLWGARGMGKSAAVKAVQEAIRHDQELPLILIEIGRDDLKDMQLILEKLWDEDQWRFILFCDDMSFEQADESYKSLKTVLDGGIGGRPPNVLFYATSNRRHLMPNEDQGKDPLQQQEGRHERISISDRFGLWIGFHGCNQDEYLEMIDRYVDVYDLPVKHEQAREDALLWSKTRGSRTGRVAWQFILDLAGRLNVKLY